MTLALIPLFFVTLSQALAQTPPPDFWSGLTTFTAARGVQTELEADYKVVFHNRKKVANPDQLTQDLLDHLKAGPGLSLTALDYSLESDPVVKARNIITHANDQAVGGRAYASLSPAERAQFIFAPLRQLLQTSPGVLHVDHHYPLKSVAATSTTVLVADFLAWLHTEGDSALLQRLSRSVGILDHSDADIVLSHFLVRHAQDGKLLASHGRLLSDVALYNDYLQEPAGVVRYRGEVRFVFDVALALEKEIADGKTGIAEAHAVIRDALTFVERLRTVLPGDAVELESTLLNQRVNYSGVEKRVVSLFEKSYQEYAGNVLAATPLEQEALLAVALGKFEVKPGEIPQDTIRKSGPVLAVFLTEKTTLSEASVMKRFLESKQSPLLNGVSYLLLSIVNPSTGARFMKIRTLKADASVDPFYPKFKAAGFEAGGRSAAGAPAYGKAGVQGLTHTQAAADLARVIEILSDCDSALL